ncbi:MAG: DNA repair helicase XPB [Treponema sp.]
MQELKPLIIQGDRTILLDVHTPEADDARFELIPFTELEKSPEHIHTYKISHLSLWNAASAGFSVAKIIGVLSKYSRYPVQSSVIAWMTETMTRYGKILLQSSDCESHLVLKVENSLIFKELSHLAVLKKYIIKEDELDNYFLIDVLNRGNVKQVLLQHGWPCKDEVPLKEGQAFPIELRESTATGAKFEIRDYQKEAAMSFVGNKEAGTGFGTIALPCGAGKTIVGLIVMSLLKVETVILTTNISSVYQWKREILDKTNIKEEDIGIYSSNEKVIKPITIATYQILTWRENTVSEFVHFKIFKERNWGLIIYDEVHLLPAPVFRVTAELQVVRRLGLTATLVREDGHEGDIFSLVGPKRFDVPWKDLEQKGWIAKAYCVEVNVELATNKEIEYAVSDTRQKYRIASENSNKIPIIKKIAQYHKDDSILVIGQYISQLEEIAKELEAPILTGKSSIKVREKLYDEFRKGEVKIIIVSKIANFAIDLPDASVAIQISGSYGSRQEEAQRLGRILRPKEKNSYFYTITTKDTVEREFAEKRQKFLAEQGYDYTVLNEGSIEEYFAQN